MEAGNQFQVSYMGVRVEMGGQQGDLSQGPGRKGQEQEEHREPLLPNRKNTRSRREGEERRQEGLSILSRQV